jgi:hypothetical protein
VNKKRAQNAQWGKKNQTLHAGKTKTEKWQVF